MPATTIFETSNEMSDEGVATHPGPGHGEAGRRRRGGSSEARDDRTRPAAMR